MTRSRHRQPESADACLSPEGNGFARPASVRTPFTGTSLAFYDELAYDGIAAKYTRAINDRLSVFGTVAGLPLFNTKYPEGAVCPGDYEKISDLLVSQLWSWSDADTK